MKNKKILLILVLVFVFLLGGASILYRQMEKELAPEQLDVQETQETQETGELTESGETEQAKAAAPDFTVCDKDGNEIHLSDYIGKPVVLNFWASWCGPCKMELPDFQEKYLEHGEEVQFLMINLTDGTRETMDGAAAFVSEQGYTFPVFYDTKSSASAAYGTYSIPVTYFIDSEGYAVGRAVGAIDGETLQRGIAMIMP